MGSYFSFLLAILVCGVISALASARVHRAYDHYGRLAMPLVLVGLLIDGGILTDEEMAGAGQVLSAAAMTYLAAMFTSLVYFLRFMFFVTTMFGRRRD